MEFLTWVQNLPISQYVLTNLWLQPLLLAGHSVGMGLVVGIIWMMDVRILGLLRNVPVRTFGRLAALGWAGLALNVATGTLMLMSRAYTYLTLWTFQLKIACILLAGICLWLQARDLRAARRAPLPGDELHSDAVMTFTPHARLMAMASLAFWLGAIAFGRLIAYTGPEGI